MRDEVASPRTLIERAYSRLREDIIEGRLAPGTKLRVEHLRGDYGVSGSTLREALTHLVSDSLVGVEGQRGFRVTAVTMEDLEDLTNLRVRIEIDALRASMRNATPQWHAQIGEIFAQMSEFEQPILPQRARRWEALNDAFHETLVSGCNSGWTLRLLRILSRHSERYRRYSIGLNQGRRDVHAEHQQIVDAVLAGNELRAALALEAHIRATPDLLKAAQARGIDVFGTRPAPAGDRAA